MGPGLGLGPAEPPTSAGNGGGSGVVTVGVVTVGVAAGARSGGRRRRGRGGADDVGADDVVRPGVVVGAFDDVDPWKSTHGSVRSTVCRP